MVGYITIILTWDVNAEEVLRERTPAGRCKGPAMQLPSPLQGAPPGSRAAVSYRKRLMPSTRAEPLGRQPGMGNAKVATLAPGSRSRRSCGRSSLFPRSDKYSSTTEEPLRSAPLAHASWMRTRAPSPAAATARRASAASAGSSS